MLRIISCKKKKDKLISRYFNDIIKPLSLKYVFNPSFHIDNNKKIFAFRGIVNGDNQLSSFVSIEDKNKHVIKNISQYLSKELGVRTIDPKIFRINKDFYITFNSGWYEEGNDIFIMKIYPRIEKPKKITYKNRNKQERNWAFFSEKEKIYALYWINPLKILKLKRKGRYDWEFEDYYSEEERKNNLPNDLTIGTQMYKEKGIYHFIAHKKILFRKKKIYFGRFCSFDFDNKQIKAGKHWIVHSLRSIFGNKIKHNTNLFSCTYFSGLQVLGDSVRLGYGVNDVEEGFSKHKMSDL